MQDRLSKQRDILRKRGEIQDQILSSIVVALLKDPEFIAGGSFRGLRDVVHRSDAYRRDVLIAVFQHEFRRAINYLWLDRIDDGTREARFGARPESSFVELGAGRLAVHELDARLDEVDVGGEMSREMVLVAGDTCLAG